MLAKMFFGRRLVFLQLVDVDDGEAGFGFGIFYGDESGFVSFLCVMGKGLLCSSWGFFFRVTRVLHWQRILCWGILVACSV